MIKTRKLKDEILECSNIYLVQNPEEISIKLENLYNSGINLNSLTSGYAKSVSTINLDQRIEMTYAVLSYLKNREAPLPVSELLIKFLVYTLKKNQSFKDQIINTTIKNWKAVDPELLFLYCEGFSISIEINELIMYSDYLLLCNKYRKAAILAHSFKFLVSYI